jgi:xanthine dehydrogenase accessory factor
MNKVRSWIGNRLKRGERIVLAAVTFASGSTARGNDALMAMDESGALIGTVGGGFAESQTITEMQALFAPFAPRARDLQFDLSPEASQSPMACGGSLTIHLERIEPNQESAGSLLACFSLLDSGSSSGVAILYSGDELDPSQGISVAFAENYSIIEHKSDTKNAYARLQRAILYAKPNFNGAVEIPVQKESIAAPSKSLQNERIFWLGFAPDPIMYIFGAGHVGLATCEAASLAGFNVVVTDDRPELLTAERFPCAHMLRQIESFADPLSAAFNAPTIDPGPQDCALILTRKPEIDKEMLASLLKTRAGYIGLIGSKTKRDGIFSSLKEDGFSEMDLARVHAPIGLAIGARTPEEIAISILAEIVAVRAGIVPAVVPLAYSNSTSSNG